MQPRIPCCLEPNSRCGTRYAELKSWVCRVTGKGVKVVKLAGVEQGGPPFYAQPVGFDGRSFFLGWDTGCDTEKLLHEACHFFFASRERRHVVNYGLGPAQFCTVDQDEADMEELSTGLLQRKLAPIFQLPEKRLYKPDYNVANKRRLDWDAGEQRATEMFEKLLPTMTLPADTKKPAAARDSQGTTR